MAFTQHEILGCSVYHRKRNTFFEKGTVFSVQKNQKIAEHLSKNRLRLQFAIPAFSSDILLCSPGSEFCIYEYKIHHHLHIQFQMATLKGLHHRIQNTSYGFTKTKDNAFISTFMIIFTDWNFLSYKIQLSVTLFFEYKPGDCICL